MKILFLSDDFPPMSYGGAGISTFELARGMARAGNDVSVITTCRNSEDAGVFPYEGMRVYRIASSYNRRWRSYISINNRTVVREVKRILSDVMPDIVHANNVHEHLSWASLKCAKHMTRGVVWTARDVVSFNYGKLMTKRYFECLDAHTTWLDHISQAGKRWNPFRNMLVRRYLRYADIKCAVSTALAKALAQNGIRSVVAVRTGIDPSEWEVPTKDIDTIRARFGLAHKRIIFFGGRLNASGQALRAFARITEKIPDAVLIVAGPEDSFGENLKAEARSLQIEHRIVYTGWVAREHLKVLIAASDIVLVPSGYFDAFPRVALEGMAAGKPVIATRYGGALEAVKDGETGYVIDPRNPEEIAQKAVELLAHPEQMHRMGRAGRERIEREFNLASMVKKYEKLYEACLMKI